MTRASLLRAGSLLVALGLSAAGAARADDAFYSDAKVTPVLEQALADIPGKVVGMAVIDYPPGGRTDIHAVSRNASKTAPAKFLVVFVKDAGTPVLEPAH